MASLPDRNTLLASFVAISPAMLDVLSRVELYADARTPVVLVGATGTGKTTLAEFIHAWKGHAAPFVAHTAGEFDPGLERSQIFGHERGAFTGAEYRLAGILEEAGDGTLLLDDFHHLPVSTQTVLLRALDQWVVRRLGGSRDLSIRCRVIIGLAEPPDASVAQGTMLEELRFRLGYSIIRLPPLGERREDIPQLAERFLRLCPAETGVPGPERLAAQTVGVLQSAAWPGNVRQLRMVIREAYIRGRRDSVLRVKHLGDLVTFPVRFERRGHRRANAHAVELALEAVFGDADAAAKLLHTARSTIYRYRPPQLSRSSAVERSDSSAETAEADRPDVPRAPEGRRELPPDVLGTAARDSEQTKRPSLTSSDSPPRDSGSDESRASSI